MALDPALEQALRVANSHSALGDEAEAGTWFREALALDPDNPATWLAILSVECHDVAEPSSSRLESIPARRTFAGEEEAMWHFAVAKLHDRHGRHGRAWDHYRDANRLLHRSRPVDDHVDDAHLATVLDLVDHAWFDRLLESVAASTARPVFVLGFPGSGTTLVEQILASHPLVRGGGEQVVVMRAAVALTEHVAPGESYVAGLDEVDPAVITEQAAVAEQAYAVAAGSLPRVTDKLPANYHHVGLIRVLFPTAPIVHVRRDPVDVCVTNYLRMYPRHHHYANDLDSLARTWANYRRITDHWQATMPDPMLEVAYEDLVADQVGQTRRLLAHAGLAWDEQCLAFHETRRLVRTASRDAVRKPIYTTSVGRSRRFGENLQPLGDALARHGVVSALTTQPT